MTTSTNRRRLSRVLRATALGMVLAVAAIVVPDSAVAPVQVTLVKLHQGSGVDLSPDVIWILAVGSDARPGEDMTHSRGDALQLIGMNTQTGAATAIGIPRDSWVSIPGYGSNRINASLYFGGPELLGKTVGNLIGIQPDYVFVTRFQFFSDMVRYLGGITVNNPVAFSDEYLMKDGFRKGRIHLGPYEALAFSRIRHNLIRGDFDRSANQQRTLRGIQANVRAHADQPGFIEGGVLTVMKHMYTDLSPAELFKIGHAMAQVDPSKITNCVVQGGIGNIGGASVVLPYVDQARSYGNDARRDATIKRC
ncbi:LCP family protein [Nocardioides sp.]|jgi:LCP family protein required for cell wall assembly|uniref:LCP family protein n=1 Tax=Nocardioides sp. TaxID=35761 RepID=UPI0031FF06B3|nr:cell envelope-related transcriptional attenuator [Nocardioides sp.]